MIQATNIDELAELLAEKLATKLASREQLVGRADLAKAAGVSTRTIDRWCESGVLKPHKAGRRVLFSLSGSLEAIRNI